MPSLNAQQLAEAWLRHSDAGDVAAEIWYGHKSSEPPVTLLNVSESFDQLSFAATQTEKTNILAGLFQRFNDQEIRCYVKILLSEIRMGVLEGTVEDAVSVLTEHDLDAIRAANRHTADLGKIALEARQGVLQMHEFAYFLPVDCMLAHPAIDATDVISRLGSPVWVEDKYDGIRCQLHKRGLEIHLFSRDRKDMTRQFPDVHDAFAAVHGDFALDGEIMILKNGQSMPFSRLQQRLNRVKPTASIIALHPAALVAFDVIAIGTESLLDLTLAERRKRLESLALPKSCLVAPQMLAESEAALETLFSESRSRGNEGLMCKDSQSAYASGRRGYKWLKLKKALEPLDVVIVGAEWGHGKRKDVLSDYTFAVRDGSNNTLVTIGKAYGGLTDGEIAALTQELQQLTVQIFGRYRTVEPKVVLEIAFNGIQKSARHKSGYALRFPRILRIRTDKSLEDINTVDDVSERFRMYESFGPDDAALTGSSD